MNRKTRTPLILVIILLLLSIFLIVLVTQKRGSTVPDASESTASESTAEASADVSESRKSESSEDAGSVSSEETSSEAESSSEPASSESSESSENSESSDVGGSSETSSEASSESSSTSSISEEDLPDDPDPQFETSESYFDDINVKVLTAVLSRDFGTLSEYVGEAGLRLCPMGEPSENDITLSASEVADFFSRGSEMYGIYLGSGNPIRMTPDEYYSSFINPSAFDFTACTTLYDDEEDLAAAGAFGSDIHTVGYHYVPNIMEWQNVIFVYQRYGEQDLLVGIIYQDLTTG